MLPEFNLDELRTCIPFNVCMLGNRRCGKSTLIGEIAKQFQNEFDLMISFMGSKFCNDSITRLISEKYDSRLNFAFFKEEVLETLWKQQTELIANGQKRNVLLVFDDVFANNPRHVEVLTKLFLRGRHNKISCMWATVSPACIPKNLRRGIDTFFLFSVLTGSDSKMLCEEYCAQNNIRAASFVLRNLEKYQSLVLTTYGMRQQLRVFTAKIKSQMLQQQDHNECDKTRDDFEMEESFPSHQQAIDDSSQET